MRELRERNVSGNEVNDTTGLSVGATKGRNLKNDARISISLNKTGAILVAIGVH